MAHDLGPAPVTGLEAQLCGDAHLINLGAYAAPHRDLVIDLNDFDEGCRGPWEWDLKRLCTSVILAGGEAGHGDEACLEAVRGCVRNYRETLHASAELSLVDLARFEIRPPQDEEPFAPAFEKAKRNTPQQLMKKALGADFRFQDRAPFLRPLGDEEALDFRSALPEYRQTLSANMRQILDGYTPMAFAQRVAGCGSLGVMNVLLYGQGNGLEDALFLEFKAQWGSAWDPYLPTREDGHAGRRTAETQQRLQTWHDPFLGWTTVAGVEFLVKQWSDHKASLEVNDLRGPSLEDYAALCGSVLAKGHARSSDPGRLSGYVGHSPNLDVALALFARDYANQCTRDWETLKAGIKAGTLRAEADSD
jgi:uncharacterized protein (DUF2252 family)